MESLASQNVLHRIQYFHNNLSEKEKLVAKYILENPSKIIYASITQIANELEIADATVFRFCKRLGFNGFQDFKIALAFETVNPINDILETIHGDDEEIEISKKVFESNIKAIEQTREVQTAESIKIATEHLEKAKSVYFYGNGGSGIVGLDAQHKFLRTGLFCQAFTDTHLQLMSASQLDQFSVAFFISHSGTNSDLLDVLDVAKERKAKTIGITNFAKSPLSKMVDVCLFTSAQETEHRPEALSSRIAELSIIDTLFVNYSIKQETQTKAALAKIRDAVSRKKEFLK